MSSTQRGKHSRNTPEDPDFDFTEIVLENGTPELHIVPASQPFYDHRMAGDCPCDPRSAVEKGSGRVAWLHREMSGHDGTL